MDEQDQKNREHKKAKRGAKIIKAKSKEPHVKGNNPKAFSIQHADKTLRKMHYVLDKRSKKRHIPIVKRLPDEPPPIVVAIVGPPKVGKSTLMRGIIKNYAKQRLSSIRGPVTIVSGKDRRLTLIECENDINCMIDMAKVADLVLLLVDAQFGFEMEIFEFLNICQVHGFPRIMGVLTHLDAFKEGRVLRKTKKRIKSRFWSEIYKGAKLFYLSGMVHGEYVRSDVHNLCRFISTTKFRPLEWRLKHPYLMADRMEDITHQHRIEQNQQCDRVVSVYGYVRGSLFKDNHPIHIPGCGDFVIHSIEHIFDPCPPPKKEKKRTLDAKERLMYAPMSGVGGIVYDKDAVYIDVGVPSTQLIQDKANNELLAGLTSMNEPLESRMSASHLTLLTGTQPLSSLNKEQSDENNLTETLVYDESDDNGDDNSDGSDDDIDNLTQSLTLKSTGDENVISGDIRWKSGMIEKAAELFRERQKRRTNYSKIVYGHDVKTNEETHEAVGDEMGGLFHVLKVKSERSNLLRVSSDGHDCTRDYEQTQQLSLDELLASIRDCFITGRWDQTEDAETLLKQDDHVYGDFEDLETGQKFGGEGDKNTEKSGEDIGMAVDARQKRLPETALERRLARKRKLKERFDKEYDEGDSKFYDEWKAETENQTKMNQSEFEGLPDHLRVDYEGYRPGMYVRVEICNVPCEFVINFNPTYPLIIGGLMSVEKNIGCVQTRFKKHRWYKKILKTRNPLIISLGWRRFQTLPLYSIQDHNKRSRLLKYTPEHMHCEATFWGPLTSQGAGLMAVESLTGDTPNFRVAGTGVVLELDKSMVIVKKLKLTGEPIKVAKKTANIKGMFNSPLEVAKFQGARIRTVSGIRGQIKKAIREPKGGFRATFEDTIRKNDIVFVRTWYPVEVPQFYNPVVTNLLSMDERLIWQGMKSVGLLRYERGLKVEQKPNSLYRKIERKPPNFRKLVIPAKLQRNLPFDVTPKDGLTARNKEPFERVAVVRDEHETKVARLMSMISELNRHKELKEKEIAQKRVARTAKVREKIELGKERKYKDRKKALHRALGKFDAKNNKNKIQ